MVSDVPPLCVRTTELVHPLRAPRQTQVRVMPLHQHSIKYVIVEGHSGNFACLAADRGEGSGYGVRGTGGRKLTRCRPGHVTCMVSWLSACLSRRCSTNDFFALFNVLPFSCLSVTATALSSCTRPLQANPGDTTYHNESLWPLGHPRRR